MPHLRPLAVAAFVLAGFGSSTARAQFVDSPSQAFVVTPGEPVLSAAPVVVAAPPMTWRERRAARRQVRYQAMRPTYASGPGFTFAPYSDRYYPRTIVDRDASDRAVTPQPTVTRIYPR